MDLDLLGCLLAESSNAAQAAAHLETLGMLGGSTNLTVDELKPLLETHWYGIRARADAAALAKAIERSSAQKEEWRAQEVAFFGAPVSSAGALAAVASPAPARAALSRPSPPARLASAAQTSDDAAYALALQMQQEELQAETRAEAAQREAGDAMVASALQQQQQQQEEGGGGGGGGR